MCAPSRSHSHCKKAVLVALLGLCCLTDLVVSQQLEAIPCHSYLFFHDYQDDVVRLVIHTDGSLLAHFGIAAVSSADFGSGTESDKIRIDMVRLLHMREFRELRCQERSESDTVAAVLLLEKSTNVWAAESNLAAWRRWNAHVLALVNDILVMQASSRKARMHISVVSLDGALPFFPENSSIEEFPIYYDVEESAGQTQIRWNEGAIRELPEYLAYGGKESLDKGLWGGFDVAVVTGPMGASAAFIAGIPVVLDLMGSGSGPLGSQTLLHHNAIMSPSHALYNTALSSFDNLAPILYHIPVTEYQNPLFPAITRVPTSADIWSTNDTIVCMMSTALSSYTERITLQDEAYLKIISFFASGFDDVAKTGQSGNLRFLMLSLWSQKSAYSEVFQGNIPEGVTVLIREVLAARHAEEVRCDVIMVFSGHGDEWESGHQISPTSLQEYFDESLHHRGILPVLGEDGERAVEIRVNGSVSKSLGKSGNSSDEGGIESLVSMFGDWIQAGGCAEALMRMEEAPQGAKHRHSVDDIMDVVSAVSKHSTMNVDSAERAVFPFPGLSEQRPLLRNRVHLDGCPNRFDLDLCRDPMRRKGLWVPRTRLVWAQEGSTNGNFNNEYHDVIMLQTQAGYMWEVAGCRIKDFSEDPEGAISCLRGKWLHFFGDSQDANFLSYMCKLLHFPLDYNPFPDQSSFSMCASENGGTILSFRFAKGMQVDVVGSLSDLELASSDTWTWTSSGTHVNHVPSYTSSLLKADIDVAHMLNRSISDVVISTTFWDLLKENMRRNVERGCDSRFSTIHRWLYSQTRSLIQMWRTLSPKTRVFVRTGGMADESKLQGARKDCMGSEAMRSAQAAVLTAAHDEDVPALDFVAMTEGQEGQVGPKVHLHGWRC